jgi:pyruvate dehydrogenase E2 component (dihydrolipoamide acetyltransferase)
VHGFGGDKNSWLFVQEPLARTHTVYALDLPGHGESAKDVGDGSLDTLAATVTGFLDALGIDRAHVVGHSMGGAVVTVVAAANPDRVRSVTLLAPVGLGGPINAAYLRGFVTAGTRRELRPHLAALFADESLVNRQLTDDLLRYKRLDGVDAALRTLLGTLLREDAQAIDVTDRLASLPVPTAIVWGREDRVIPPSPELPGVTVVDKAGHMVHMEAPAAVVATVEKAATG